MIYLIRHGLDDEKYVGGWSNGDLLPEGILQINALAQFMKKSLNISMIYSSDIKRAVTTAKIISQNINVEVKYTSKLRELNKGILNGMEVEIAKKKYPEYFDNLTINNKYPGGESMIDLYNRIKKLLTELTILDNTLLVTHRGVINMIYFILNSNLPDMNKSQFNVTHASIHELNIQKRLIKKLKIETKG